MTDTMDRVFAALAKTVEQMQAPKEIETTWNKEPYILRYDRHVSVRETGEDIGYVTPLRVGVMAYILDENGFPELLGRRPYGSMRDAARAVYEEWETQK